MDLFIYIHVSPVETLMERIPIGKNENENVYQYKLRFAKMVIEQKELPFLYDIEFEKYYTASDRVLNTFFTNIYKEKVSPSRSRYITRLMVVFLLTNNTKSKVGLFQYLYKILTVDQTIDFLREWNNIILDDYSSIAFGHMLYYKMELYEKAPELVNNLRWQYSMRTLGGFLEKMDRYHRGNFTICYVMINNVLNYHPINKKEIFKYILTKRIYRSEAISDILLLYDKEFKDLNIRRKIITSKFLLFEHNYEELEKVVLHSHSNNYSCTELYLSLDRRQTLDSLKTVTVILNENCKDRYNKVVVDSHIRSLDNRAFLEWWESRK